MSGRRKARMPVQVRGIETRMKIIDAGMELFGKNGYHKANAIGIAAHAGIGTGTFYSYFNNKKEVLIEGIKRVYSQISETMVNATLNYNFDPLKSREFVHFMVKTLVTAHEVEKDLHKKICAMILLDEEIEDVCLKEDIKVIGLIRLYLEAHKDILRVNDYEAAATAVLRISDEIIHRAKVYKIDIERERLINELEDMLCRYLLKDH